ncbi:MAG: hypothetical protein QM601_05015 [Pseudoxanthomonas sp.]
MASYISNVRPEPERVLKDLLAGMIEAHEIQGRIALEYGFDPRYARRSQACGLVAREIFPRKRTQHGPDRIPAR